MTAGQRDPGAGRRQLWVRRFTTLAVTWLAVWGVSSWLQMRPDALGLAAALGAFFAVLWWASDRLLEWDPTEWEGEPIGRRMATGPDSRISYLRRLIDDAAVPKDNGVPNASAGSLQGILRDVSLDRLRLRAAESGAAHVPDDTELLAQTDPRLAAFLTADPAPPVNRQTVTDIINRIEAL